MRYMGPWIALVISTPLNWSYADDLLYGYDADALPHDPTAGWIVADPCDPPCTELLEDGHFVLFWPQPGNLANYDLTVAAPPALPPPAMWVEWSYRSNHLRGPFFDSCDGFFSIHVSGMSELVLMYGDSASSFSGNDVIFGLDPNEFHTYRFEHYGFDYTITIDGNRFISDGENSPTGVHFLQFTGRGGCIDDSIPDMANEWDFIRYGTREYGEQLVNSTPPPGFVSASDYPDRTRFTVTFDSPNYVYVDDIAVAVANFPGVTPVAPMNYPMVTQTRRLDNSPPEVVEIVFDKPIPHAATTRFTISDGVATNIIEYTLSPGDADGDGLATLADFAHFQNCFRPGSPSAFCKTFDLNRNAQLNLVDYLLFQSFLVEP